MSTCNKYALIRYQVIGENNVAVPTHFFKIIVGEFETTKDLEMEAYVLPNEAIPDHVPIHSFQVILKNKNQLNIVSCNVI